MYICIHTHIHTRMSSSCCPPGVWFLLSNVIPTQNQKCLQAQKAPQRETSSSVKILWLILKQLNKKRYYFIETLLTSKLIIRTLLFLNYTAGQKYDSNYNMLYIVPTGVQTVSNTLKQKYFVSGFCHTFEHTLGRLYSCQETLDFSQWMRRMKDERSNNGSFLTKQISKSRKKKDQLY